MTITIDDLRRIHACTEAIAEFAATFPDGTPSWEDVVEHERYRPDWRGWNAVYAPDVPPDVRERWIERSDNPASPAATQYRAPHSTHCWRPHLRPPQKARSPWPR